MAVPKRRTSKQRKGKRRSHMGIKPKTLQACQQCNTPKPSHVICPNCGHYMGRTLVDDDE